MIWDGMRWWAAVVLGWLAALVPAGPVWAAFPDKPIRFVVPFPPGGGNDLVARTLGEGMSRDLGQQVVIDNRAGAGTMIGTEVAARSAPDGYTILMGSFAFALNPSLVKNLPYDPIKSFASVAYIGKYPNIVVVLPDRPYKTMQEFIAYAKVNPGKMNYGSFGNGTSPHLSVEMLKVMAKLDITHVPYKGAGPALTDLLGGRLDVIFSTVSSAGTFIRSNRLRPLAVTSAVRAPAYPDLPTIAEAGVPGYEAVAWYGILAPAGTPTDIIARLNASIALAGKNENFLKRSAEDGLEVKIDSPAVLDKLIADEIARWRPVVVEANIKVD
jgi:tripartite-type tricarboxylate transporter receptor subunit TctC